MQIVRGELDGEGDGLRGVAEALALGDAGTEGLGLALWLGLGLGLGLGICTSDATSTEERVRL